jgi:hypothetical protein
MKTTQMKTIKQLERETSQAIYAVGAFAEPDFIKEATATVNLFAMTGNRFSTDHIWQVLDAKGVTTSERRAMGAVIRSFTKAKKIKRVDYEPSTQQRNHRRPVAVWQGV